MTPNGELIYMDSSALVKLVIDEPESAPLRRQLSSMGDSRFTSEVALVEVHRATTITVPGTAQAAEQAVRSCLLIPVGEGVLEHARELASARLRTLDAIHLASALHVGARHLISYDRRLIDAASEAGLRVLHPGLAA